MSLILMMIPDGILNGHIHGLPLRLLIIVSECHKLLLHLDVVYRSGPMRDLPRLHKGVLSRLQGA
jgi:hypothetical protein